MRVAHYVQRFPPALGGSEIYFARLSRFLADRGDDVTVFTSNALDLEAFWSRKARVVAAGVAKTDGVTVERYPLLHLPARRYLLKALSFFPNRRWRCFTLTCNPVSWRMWHDAKRDSRRFDVVHATAFPYAWPILCALRRARCQGLPFFLTPFLHLGSPDHLHDRTRQTYLSAPLRSLLLEADGIFVQTHLERDAVLACDVRPERVHLQGMGVEAAECTGGDRGAARRAWRVDESGVVVGHLANQSHEKGTIDLLRAADLLWQAGHRFRVVLAGPTMPNFQAFWQTFQRKDAVIQLGVLDEQQKRDFYAGIDLFALPSRSDSFGLVLLEAWVNDRTNLAYRSGGIAEVVRDGEDGLLSPLDDIPHLAEGLLKLLADADLRKRLAGNGRKRALEEFDWPSKLELVHKVYTAAIEKKKSRD